MKQLIAKLNLTESMGNKKIFKIFEYESGEIGYSLTNSHGISFSTSNLQCGWRGPLLPDNVFEYESPKQLLESVIEAVNGGVSNVDSSTLFLTTLNLKYKIMGVDISGKNPIIRSEKPQFPSNEVWNKMSDKAKDEFFRLDSEWNNENPGDYFRSNWWGWRPIVMLTELVNETRDLGLDLEYWGSNDGRGLDTQEECNKLADALEEIGKEFFDVEDIDELQLCMGSWTTLDGQFIPSTKTDKLNDEWYGQLLTSPLVMDDGTVVKSSHSVDKQHLQRFISFLRECGGFEIW